MKSPACITKKKTFSFLDIFHILLEAFGEQGWWPLFPSKGKDNGNEPLEPQYYLGPPRNEGQRFEIAVGAILTQNANWKNATQALIQLKKENLLQPSSILKASPLRLEKLIRSSGYFRQKALRLQVMAQFFKDFPPRKRKNLSSQELYQILGALHGVGPETRDTILLYAFGEPFFVIDAYTLRILDRLGLGALKYNEGQKVLEDSLPKDISIYREFHA
ncbi:MAG: endonuclease III domain-containing protein, partial [Planctomycetota bacterium]